MTYPRIEKPTEPGWYWFRQIGPNWKCAEVAQMDGVLCVINFVRCPSVESLGGDWRGRIPEPTE